MYKGKNGLKINRKRKKYEQNVKKVRESQIIFAKTLDKWKKEGIITIVSTRHARVLKRKRGEGMELSPRKQAVLKAVINAYIKSGEPIGSKNLTALLENAPSSATLRNEMSELCELGLLSQPHTSAGRVPTHKGYSMYVRSLMTPAEPTLNEKNMIDSTLGELNCEPESMPSAAAEVLSKFYGMTAIACWTAHKTPRVKRVELMPIGRNSAMLLVIADDGRTRSRVFRYAAAKSEETDECFKTLVKEKIINKSVSDLTKGYLQSLIASAGIYALELIPAVTAIFDAANELEQSSLALRGENSLYNVCGDEVSAARLISLIKQGDPIIELLRQTDKGIGAVFGTDTGYSELNKSSIIAAPFETEDKNRGYIALIGPERMNYEKIMPVVKYAAERLAEIMSRAQKDMED